MKEIVQKHVNREKKMQQSGTLWRLTDKAKKDLKEATRPANSTRPSVQIRLATA